MNKTAIAFCLIFGLFKMAGAQNKIEWQPGYTLRLSDFQSPSTRIGQSDFMSITTTGNFNFGYQMSNGAFMFTKNFNGMVHCTFLRDAATLIAPDTATANRLLDFARYQFDLAELYARKLRRELYEKKNAFSETNFYQPIFDSVQAAYQKRFTMAQSETHLGTNTQKLQQLHQQVLQEISAMADYCSSCKPKRKHLRGR
ncbi:MAG TPA: hypothetical protein VFL76_05795 [Edaphocola sp.]|nr:hypothetical protein [Edaphocola sp.]